MLDVWEQVIAVNLTRTFLSLHEAVPVLRASGGGAIVNICSVVTLSAGSTGAAYHKSKGGVLTLTKAASIEFARDGVRVNSVHPGTIDTLMAAGARGDDSGARRSPEDRHPLGRLARPEEVASAALSLAGDTSSFATGASFVVDGGYGAW